MLACSPTTALRYLLWSVALWFVVPESDLVAQNGSHAGMVWAPAGSLLRARPAEGGGGFRVVGAAEESVDGFTLDGTDVLFIPVDAGDDIKVEGRGLRVGLGFGGPRLPDAIAWQPWTDDDSRLRVATYSQARFLAIGSRDGKVHAGRVRVATPTPRAYALYGYERTMARFFEAPESRLPPPSPAPFFDHSHHILLGIRDALGVVPEASEGLRARVLHNRLQGELARTRPLTAPYFERQPLALAGGRVAQPDGEDGWAEIGPGSPLEIAAGEAQLVRLALSLPAVGHSRVRISSEHRTERVIERHLTQPTATGWSEPTAIRLWAADSGSVLRVTVEAGAARVLAVGYAPLRDLFGSTQSDDVAPPTWRPETLADTAEPSGGAVATDDELLLLGMLGGQSAQERLEHVLQAGRLTPGKQAIAYCELGKTLVEQPARLARVVHEAALATQALAPSTGSALFLDLLQHLAFADVQLEELPMPSWAGREGEGEVDRTANLTLRVLQALLTAKGSRPDPGLAAEVERYLSGVDAPGLGRWMRKLWFVSGAKTLLQPSPGTPSIIRFTRPSAAQMGDDQCDTQGPTGQRWTDLSVTRTVAVAETSGTHSLINLRTESLAEDVTARIGQADVTVHGSIGFGARVATRPGIVTLSGAPGLLARIPRAGKAPCAALRDAARFYEVEGTTEFLLPRLLPGSFADLTLDTPAEGAQTVMLKVGEAQYSLSLQGRGSHQLQVPLPGHARSLALQTKGTMLARVRALLPARPRTAAPALLLNEDAYDDEDLERALARLRELSLARSADAPDEQHLSRAQEQSMLLERLGQGSLADAVRKRFALSTEDASDALASERSPDGAILAAAAPDVVAIGYLSSLPPLPPPQNQARTASLRRLLRIGPSGEALRGLWPPTLPRDAEGLLWVVAAQRALSHRRAADWLAELGHRHHSAPTMAQAAKAMARAALLTPTEDRKTWEDNLLRAWALTHEAESLGASIVGTRARLSGLISPLSPNRLDGGAGFAFVETTSATSLQAERLSLGQRARRALLGAPQQSSFLERGRRLVLRRAGSERLVLHSRCLGDPEAAPCALRAQVDGMVAPCWPLASPDDGETNGLSPPRACELPISAGQHLIYLDFGSAPAIGWVSVTSSRDGDLSRRTVSRWHELDAERPAQLSVLGPTVITIDARGLGSAPQQLTVAIRGQDESEVRVLPLDTTVGDPTAQLFRHDMRNSTLPVRAEARLKYPVLSAGLHHLQLSVDRGRMLVDPSIAVVDTPQPRQQMTTASPEAPLETGAQDAASTPVAHGPEPRPLVDEPTRRGPVSLGASVGVLARDLMEGDRDQASTFAELGLHARRQLIRRRLWARLSLLGRARDGAESAGLEASLQVPAQGGGIPGFFFFGRAMSQAGDDRVHWGGRLQLGTRWALSPADNVRILPSISMTLRHTDDQRAGRADADPDVYSAWANDNPRSLDVGLSLLHRPYLDAAFFYTATARSNPDGDGLDRVEARAHLEALPWSGWSPWVKLQVSLGYRPQASYRETPFARLGLTGETLATAWVGKDLRIALGGTLAYRIDAPGRGLSDSSLFGGLTLYGDFLPGAGLSDFVPYERRFLDRMQDGAELRQPVRRAPFAPWREP